MLYHSGHIFGFYQGLFLRPFFTVDSTCHSSNVVKSDEIFLSTKNLKRLNNADSLSLLTEINCEILRAFESQVLTPPISLFKGKLCSRFVLNNSKLQQESHSKLMANELIWFRAHIKINDSRHVKLLRPVLLFNVNINWGVIDVKLHCLATHAYLRTFLHLDFFVVGIMKNEHRPIQRQFGNSQSR